MNTNMTRRGISNPFFFIPEAGRSRYSSHRNYLALRRLKMIMKIKKAQIVVYEMNFRWRLSSLYEQLE